MTYTTCPTCARSVPSARALCVYCGAKLASNPCQGCGKELPQGGGACRYCGVSPSGPAQRSCPRCARPVRVGLSACQWCAAELEASAPAAAAPAPGAVPPSAPASAPRPRWGGVDSDAYQVTLRPADEGLDRSQQVFLALLCACVLLAGSFAVARGALRNSRPSREDFFREATAPAPQPSQTPLLELPGEELGEPEPPPAPPVTLETGKAPGVCAFRDCPDRASEVHRVVVDTGQVGWERGRTTIYLAEVDVSLCPAHAACAREGSWPMKGVEFVNVAVVGFVAVVGGLVLFAPLAWGWKLLAAAGKAPPFPAAG